MPSLREVQRLGTAGTGAGSWAMSVKHAACWSVICVRVLSSSLITFFDSEAFWHSAKQKKRGDEESKGQTREHTTTKSNENGTHMPCVAPCKSCPVHKAKLVASSAGLDVEFSMIGNAALPGHFFRSKDSAARKVLRNIKKQSSKKLRSALSSKTRIAPSLVAKCTNPLRDKLNTWSACTIWVPLEHGLTSSYALVHKIHPNEDNVPFCIVSELLAKRLCPCKQGWQDPTARRSHQPVANQNLTCFVTKSTNIKKSDHDFVVQRRWAKLLHLANLVGLPTISHQMHSHSLLLAISVTYAPHEHLRESFLE